MSDHNNLFSVHHQDNNCSALADGNHVQSTSSWIGSSTLPIVKNLQQEHQIHADQTKFNEIENDTTLSALSLGTGASKRERRCMRCRNVDKGNRSCEATDGHLCVQCSKVFGRAYFGSMNTLRLSMGDGVLLDWSMWLRLLQRTAIPTSPIDWSIDWPVDLRRYKAQTRFTVLELSLQDRLCEIDSADIQGVHTKTSRNKEKNKDERGREVDGKEENGRKRSYKNRKDNKKNAHFEHADDQTEQQQRLPKQDNRLRPYYIQLELDYPADRESGSETHLATESRAPLIHMNALDIFVMDHVWGPLFQVPPEGMLTPEEVELLSKSQLFGGYLHLIAHLSTTLIQSSCTVRTLSRSIVAHEVVYALLFRAQQCWNRTQELCNCILRSQDRRTCTKTISQALEIQHLFLSSITQNTWFLPEVMQHHPLGIIRNNMIAWSQDACQIIEAFECALGDVDGMPKSLKMWRVSKHVKSRKNGSRNQLPKHLWISIIPHQDYLSPPRDLFSAYGMRNQAVSVLDALLSKSDLPNAETEIVSPVDLPTVLVDKNNETHNLAEIVAANLNRQQILEPKRQRKLSFATSSPPGMVQDHTDASDDENSVATKEPENEEGDGELVWGFHALLRRSAE